MRPLKPSIVVQIHARQPTFDLFRSISETNSVLTHFYVISELAYVGVVQLIERLVANEEVVGLNPIAHSNARSSNGRTAAFEAVNDGSSPSLATMWG